MNDKIQVAPLERWEHERACRKRAGRMRKIEKLVSGALICGIMLFILFCYVFG